ncbi:hypothetical protein HOY80DRAFT_1002307 [Tuber brumale]|nr:hypothetical protein HOY80DRAFT_1002307 [Tuber brumale]
MSLVQVSLDMSGKPQPLPAGLGNMPLYNDGDGFYSVNGPLNLTILSCPAVPPTSRDNRSTIRPSVGDLSSFPGENRRISPSRPQHCLNNDATSRFVTPPNPYSPTPLNIHHSLIVLCSGSRTSFEGRSYLCGEPGYTWQSPFPTKHAFDGHYQVKHLNIRVDCPIPGCEKVGDNGIKREDNLPAHVLNKHGIRLPRQSLGN